MTASRLRVLIVGAGGQLATELAQMLRSAHRLRTLAHSELDVTDPNRVQSALARGWDVVINCAAFVRVDDCETREAEAVAVNASGAGHVAAACRATGARCVYISTDYVFDGRQPEPYAENDVPHPLNAYGRSKLAGEQQTQELAERWLIVRLASLFGKTGARGKGGNFVETILAKARAGESLRVVDDLRMSPTYARDAAELIAALVGCEATGVFHASNTGSCTWYEFAARILKEAGLTADLRPIPSTPAPGKALRPANAALTSVRLGEVLGRVPRPWPEALRAYLAE